MVLSTADVIQTLLDVPSRSNLAAWSKQYAASTHLAGDHAHACSIQSLWQSYGIPSTIDVHNVLQNKPLDGSRVALVDPSKPDTAKTRTIHAAKLVEDVIPEDPASATGLPAFHGYSFPGAVTAPIVYANFGTPEDFQFLKDAGIKTEGHIALIKYSRIFRGLKVKAAQEAGCIGAVIYSDPQEDGEFSIKNGHLPYPDGPARHPSAIQRGSVSFFSYAVGDPADEDRPYIPSMPISYRDAAYFLKALEGYGVHGDRLPADWHGHVPGIKYCTGPSKLHVELVNNVAYSRSPIYNVIGKIEGRCETGEFVLLANHHDSWCSGAVDPVSGSASMNELLRGFKTLIEKGWKPYRTLILASWDMEEYGLVGSTGWAKRFEEVVKAKCVACLNVDESTTGGEILHAVGSPLLSSVLYRAAKYVPSPLPHRETAFPSSSPSTTFSSEDDESWEILPPTSQSQHTIYSDWLAHTQTYNPNATVPEIGIMGTGADYTVFQHHLGIPALDLNFAVRNRTTFQYHTKYDSYTWMSTRADLGFRKHKALTQLWGIVAILVCDEEVLDYNTSAYTTFMEQNLPKLNSQLPETISLTPLVDAIQKFKIQAAAFDNLSTIPKSKPSSQSKATTLRALSSSFLLPYKDLTGLPHRPFYKNLIFGPGIWLGYTGVAFPGITDAISEGTPDMSWVEGVEFWIQITAEVVLRAAEVLEGANGMRRRGREEGSVPVRKGDGRVRKCEPWCG